MGFFFPFLFCPFRIKIFTSLFFILTLLANWNIHFNFHFYNKISKKLGFYDLTLVSENSAGIQLFFQVRDLNFCRSHFNAKLYFCLPDLVEKFHFCNYTTFQIKIPNKKCLFHLGRPFMKNLRRKLITASTAIIWRVEGGQTIEGEVTEIFSTNIWIKYYKDKKC